MKKQAGRLAAIWGITVKPNRTIERANMRIRLGAVLVGGLVAMVIGLASPAGAATSTPHASTVIPTTVTNHACDGDFGTLFNPMVLCLYFTVNGSGAHVNYFRAEVCVSPDFHPVNFFHGHVEFMGRSGVWNTSHLTVSEGQCKTATVHINRNLKTGRYTARAWQNNGNGNFRDLVNVSDNIR